MAALRPLAANFLSSPPREAHLSHPHPVALPLALLSSPSPHPPSLPNSPLSFALLIDELEAIEFSLVSEFFLENHLTIPGIPRRGAAQASIVRQLFPQEQAEHEPPLDHTDTRCSTNFIQPQNHRQQHQRIRLQTQSSILQYEAIDTAQLILLLFVTSRPSVKYHLLAPPRSPDDSSLLVYISR